jgi:RimJ/RimL family protein N-acetyltransferase
LPGGARGDTLRGVKIEPVTLEGRHVRLEPLSRDHLDALWAVAADPDLWRHTLVRIASRDELAAYLDAALADEALGTALPFATVDLASGSVAGSTRFINASPRDLRVEIGHTFVGRRFQRTAVNTEAKYLMIRHAFERWGCVRVELRAAARNERSRAAIRRIGGIEEGILRRHARMHDGTWRDTVCYGVLDAEWPAVRARLEAMLARRRP